MEIETFEIEEKVGGTTPELEAEAIGMIEKLGLKGQQKLVTPTPDGERERIQYPVMTQLEVAVYEAIFPEKTLVEDYEAGIIPVRIMQVIAHAREQFDKVYIWHKKVSDPDPILVALKKDTKESWIIRCFLLARWGDALMQFGELEKEARVLLEREYRAKFEKSISVAKIKLDSLSSVVEEHLKGNSTHSYDF